MNKRRGKMLRKSLLGIYAITKAIIKKILTEKKSIRKKEKPEDEHTLLEGESGSWRW